MAVVHVLYETWFRDKFRWNPVKLTDTEFRELGISPHPNCGDCAHWKAKVRYW